MARRALEAELLAAQERRFATELRERRFPRLRQLGVAYVGLGARACRRDLPRPLILLALVLIGTAGGCHVGALVSEQLGTVGDFAGGLVALGREALGGLMGFCVAVVAYRGLRRKGATSPPKR